MIMNLWKDDYIPHLLHSYHSIWLNVPFGMAGRKIISVFLWQCSRVSSWGSVSPISRGAMGDWTGSSLGMVKDPWPFMCKGFKSDLYSQGLEFFSFFRSRKTWVDLLYTSVLENHNQLVNGKDLCESDYLINVHTCHSAFKLFTLYLGISVQWQ